MECSKRNGEIDGYTLLYYPNDDQINNESLLINDGSSTSFTLVGLQPRMTYTLRLKAGNNTVSSPNNMQYAEQTVNTTVPPGILIDNSFVRNDNIIMTSYNLIFHTRYWSFISWSSV